MARILVTGGAGYVGSHCVKALAAAGHACAVYDNLSRGHREFVRWGPLVEGDVRDSALLSRTLAQGRFDAVMHFAALSEVGESVREPALYRDVNVEGTRTLLAAMRAAGLTRIVFSSTCAVYGQPEALPMTESLPLRPVNPYGETKRDCEALMDQAEAGWGLASVRLRYFNAAGADPEAEIGEWHEPESHLIPLVLRAALGGGRVSIFGTDFPTPDGTALRDYVHVMDLADAHRRALEHLLAGRGTAIANLGTGHGYSVREVVQAAESVCGRPIHAKLARRRAGDPPALVADAAHARALLGWAPQAGLRQIIEDAWRWEQRQRQHS